MVKKKTVKQGVALTLSACMVTNSVPLQNFVIHANSTKPNSQLANEKSKQTLTFDNAQSRGDWGIDTTQNKGSCTFTDIKDNVSGFMALASEVNTESAFFLDKNATSRVNGYMEMDVTSTTNGDGRILFLLRYQDKDNWEGVGLDGSGDWVWEYRINGSTANSPWGKLNGTSTSTFKQSDRNRKHHIRIEYEGKKVKIKDNDTIVFDGVVDQFQGTKNAKQGIRLWGTTSFASSFTIDNLETGDLNTPSTETITFTDASSKGGWDKTNGNGTVSFTNGADENGFMSIASNGETFFADLNAKDRTDGFVEMDVTYTASYEQAKGRILFLFRYQDHQNWEGVGLDGGHWVWQFNRPNASQGGNPWGDLTTTGNMFSHTDHQKHKIRIEYQGKKVKITDNGTLVCEKEVPRFDGSKAGKVGIRLWGDTHSSTFKIDNVRTGDLNVEPTLSQSVVEIEKTNVGQDLTIDLDAKGLTLSSIKNNQTTLTQDTHYTYDAATKKLVIKAAYLETIKNNPTNTLTLAFDGGATTTLTINISTPEPEVNYFKDFAKGKTNFVKKSGTGNIVENQDSVTVSGNVVFVDEDSKVLKNQEVEFLFNPSSYGTNYGVVLRYQDNGDYLYVGPSGQRNQHFTTWSVYNRNGNAQTSVTDNGFILANRKTPYKVKVRVVDNLVTVFVDNEQIFSREVGGITQNAGKVGFRTTGSAALTIKNFTQNNASLPKVVTSAISEKTIETNKLAVKLDQNFPRVIEYTLKDGSKVVKGQELAIHQVEINNKLYKPSVQTKFNATSATYTLSVEELGITFDVVMSVENNVLTMKINNVKETKDGVKLYTVNFPQHSLVSMSEGTLTTHNYKAQSSFDLSTRTASKAYDETTLAVLHNSTKGVAAALSGESYKNRHEVAYQTFNANGHKSTGLWLNEYTYRGLDGQVMIQEPWTKVSITADRNGDKKVDMQDGAIALRDDCMKRKVGADYVTSSWMQIAMNVGSEAQMPFLRILDNIQKMSLATDNFDQHILIKGYQGEGHDSMHPDFANYNKRAGGLKDFNTLLSESEKYNAKVGIHINHTDIYPEAPQFDDIASKDAPAWDWYDSSKMIVRENDGLDKSEKGMDKRFEQLFVTDTQNKIDTTYVDVFFGSRWPLYNIVKNIAGRNVVLGTENPDEMVSHSTFVHGIQTGKEAFFNKNNLVRFVENNQSDMFYKTNLFRGVETRNAGGDNGGRDKGASGVLGWQQSSTGNNRASFNDALDTFYTKVLPQKFLAQYPLMIYDTDNQATLGENNEVVTKWEHNKNIITLDGEKVADGNNIFIPWQTKNSEGKVVDKYGKIYHYNENGGQSTWKLPKSWGNVSKIYMYELSSNGKGEKIAVNVTNNQVTITNAKAKTPYVIYKAEAQNIKNAKDLDWSVGSHVKETGFDSYTFKNWNASSTSNKVDHITIENNNLGNAHLFMRGKKDGKVTQTITNLVPGKTYSASVWCITDDGRKATISVDNAGDVVSNYMDSSKVRYGFHHNEKYKTNAQRMQVRFVAKATTATLTLAAEAGKTDNSTVDFDDVRVMEVGVSNNPKNYTYWEDFENVDQGLGLFVSEETDKSHLSYRNQVNAENTNDVINGNFSLKIRRDSDVDGYAADVMRTIPSTVRFKPNTKYTVGLRYKVNNGGFTFAAKGGNNQDLVTAQRLNGSGKTELQFTTDATGDCYVRIEINAKGNEVIIDDFYVQEALEMNYTNLQKLIKEAEAYNSKDYSTSSYKNLQTALTAAKAIKQDTQKPAIEKAYLDLEKAMKDLVPLATSADRKLLEDEIKYMKSLPKSDYHEDDKWVIFTSKIANAEKALKDSSLTQPQVNALIQELRDAKDALNPTVNRDALKEIMRKALRVTGEAIVDGPDSQDFFGAIQNAKIADAKPGVTKEEIAKVTKELEDAYAKIIFKESSKNDLVNAALNRVEGLNSKYFFEKDWAAIQDAKAKLSTMANKNSVKVKEFYEAFDQLEAALANKSATPIVPSSIKIELNMNDNIDSNGAVEANTEHPQSGNEGPIKFAFDNNLDTLWHTRYNPKFEVSANKPAEVIINLGKQYNVTKFGYIQRRGGPNGQIQKFNLYVSNDKQKWNKVVNNGSFKNDPNEQFANFPAVNAQYVKLEITQGHGGFATAAEFAVYQKASDFAALQTLMNTVNKLDKSAYNPAYLTELNKAYDEAIKLLDNPLTEQSIINAAKDKLQKAYDEVLKLATKEDIKLFNDQLAEANKVDVSKFNNTAKFEEARTNANKLKDKLGKGKVSKEELMNALLALTAGKDAMTPITPPVTPPVDPDQGDQGQQGGQGQQQGGQNQDQQEGIKPVEPQKPGQEDKPSNPQGNKDETGTGDVTSMSMFASLLAASGAALTAIFKRKNKE